MNSDIILKFLMSEREDDNLIGLNLIRARHPDNWGAFLEELKVLIGQDVYYLPSTLTGRQIPYLLSSKYFDYRNQDLHANFYDLID